MSKSKTKYVEHARNAINVTIQPLLQQSLIPAFTGVYDSLQKLDRLII